MATKSVPKEIKEAEASALKSLFDDRTRDAKISQETFGAVNEIGTQGMVWQYLNGRAPLNLRVALKFSQGLGVPVSSFSPRLAAELAAAGENIAAEPRPHWDARRLVTTSVPVVGTAQAGDDGYWHELGYPTGHGEGRVRFPSEDSNAYALRIKGDSMRPRIKPGEFVVVEPNKPCRPGDEVLVKTINGRSMVKVLGSVRDGLVELRSINDDHKPITIEHAEIEVMHYVGGIAKSSLFLAEDS